MLIEAKSSVKAAELASAASCGVSIGLLATQVVFATEFDGWWGYAKISIGCGMMVTTSYLNVKVPYITYLGAAVCASQIAEFAHDLDDVMAHPEDREKRLMKTLSLYDTVQGCIAWYMAEVLIE